MVALLEASIIIAFVAVFRRYEKGGLQFKYDRYNTLLLYTAVLCAIQYVTMAGILGDFGSTYSLGVAAMLSTYSLPLCMGISLVLGMRGVLVMYSGLMGAIFLVGSTILKIYLY